MTDERDDASSRIDRRRLFRGAAALAVGGFGARAVLAQTPSETARASPAPGSPDAELAASKELDEQTGRVLRWAGRDPLGLGARARRSGPQRRDRGRGP